MQVLGYQQRNGNTAGHFDKISAGFSRFLGQYNLVHCPINLTRNRNLSVILKRITLSNFDACVQFRSVPGVRVGDSIPPYCPVSEAIITIASRPLCGLLPAISVRSPSRLFPSGTRVLYPIPLPNDARPIVNNPWIVKNWCRICVI